MQKEAVLPGGLFLHKGWAIVRLLEQLLGEEG